MGDTIEMFVQAWVEGAISQAQVIISAIPYFLEGMFSQAYVVVTAIPAYGVVVPGIAGVIAFIFLFGLDHYLNEEED